MARQRIFISCRDDIIQASMPEDEKSRNTGTPIDGPRYSSLIEYREEAPGEKKIPGLVLAVEEDPLTRRLETIPPHPGVYLLKDRAGKVLYVGKAKSLRPRV